MPDPWDATDGQTHYLDEHGNTVAGVSGIEGVALVSDYRGVPVVQRKQGSVMWWRAEHCPDLEPTHRAFPEPVAAALVRVAEAARHARDEGWIVSPSIDRALIEMDALAEAQAGAS